MIGHHIGCVSRCCTSVIPSKFIHRTLQLHSSIVRPEVARRIGGTSCTRCISATQPAQSSSSTTQHGACHTTPAADVVVQQLYEEVWGLEVSDETARRQSEAPQVLLLVRDNRATGSNSSGSTAHVAAPTAAAGATVPQQQQPVPTGSTEASTPPGTQQQQRQPPSADALPAPQLPDPVYTAQLTAINLHSLLHSGDRSHTACSSSSSSGASTTSDPTSSSSSRSSVPTAAAVALQPLLSQLPLSTSLPHLYPLSFRHHNLLLLLSAALASKAARRLGLVQALLLSGPYLPSHVSAVQKLVQQPHLSHLQLQLLSSRQGLHLLLAAPTLLVQEFTGHQQHTQQQQQQEQELQSQQEQQQQQGLRQLLAAVLRCPIQPLPPSRLTAAAAAAEAALTQQLRLFSAAEYARACQQLLRRSRKGGQQQTGQQHTQTGQQTGATAAAGPPSLLLVQRPLLGPTGAAAVAELVGKLGLHCQWLQVDAVLLAQLEQQQQGQQQEGQQPQQGQQALWVYDGSAAPVASPWLSQTASQASSAASAAPPATAAAAPAVILSPPREVPVLVVSRADLTAAEVIDRLLHAVAPARADTAAATTSTAASAGSDSDEAAATSSSGSAASSSSGYNSHQEAEPPEVEQQKEVVGITLHVLAGAPVDEVWGAAMAVLTRAYQRDRERKRRAVAAAAAHKPMLAPGISSSNSSSGSGSDIHTNSRRRRSRKTAKQQAAAPAAAVIPSATPPPASPQHNPVAVAPSPADVLCCALSGPGLQHSTAQQLWQCHVSRQGPGGSKQRSRVQLWAWLYFGTNEAGKESGGSSSSDASSSNASSSSDTIGSSSAQQQQQQQGRRRRRRRRRVSTASADAARVSSSATSSAGGGVAATAAHAAATPAAPAAGSGVGQAPCVLLLSLVPLQLPAVHTQWGCLQQHECINIAAEYMSSSSSVSSD